MSGLCVKCGAEIPGDAVWCPWCGKKQVTQERKSRRRANGEGSVYQCGKTWRAQVVLGYKNINGHSCPIYARKAGFQTKKEDIEYLPQLRQAQPQERRCPTVWTLWEEYQAGNYKKLSESRQEKYRIAIKKLEALHHCRIDMLTTADLCAVVSEKAETYYPARDMRDLMSLLYQIALANQYVQVNLADYIVLPDKSEKEPQAFAPDELAALWRDYQAGNQWTGYILLMCYTGMMPGELLAAQKEAVDLEGRVIIGAGIKTNVRKKKPIVLADAILPVLAAIMAEPGEKLIHINKDNFYKVYYETLERAGCRRLPPYSCRHTTATALAEAEVQAADIMAIMRHASITTTQHYIHERPDQLLRAVDRIKAGNGE